MQSPSPAAPYSPRPPKDKSLALILEILPGLFGFLGFGWIYSNQTTTGILWLVGMLTWGIIALTILVVTGGFGCFCTLPVSIALIALSAMSLSNYANRHPELFGQN